ncbi:MAG: hypothetical protein ACKV2O_00815, partial [Acidimicrobiales bacterium]
MKLTRIGCPVTVAVFMAAALLMVGSSRAHAHTGNQSYVYVDLLSDRLEGRVEYLVKDLNEALELDLVDDETTALTQLERQRPAIETYTRDHLALTFDDRQVPLQFEEFEYLELSQGSYVVYHFTTGELPGGPPRVFTVDYSAFFELPEERTALLLIGRDWKNGVLANEANHLSVFDEDRTRAQV